MLDEEFEREGFHKYISFLTPVLSNDLKMLAENQIEGVLTHELKNINGSERLYYHIEGCQPISIVYGQKEWDYAALKNLFRGICGCIYMVKEYLLPYDAILLDAGHIYWSWQQECAKFLIVPHYKASISEQLIGLTEYLMQHVNYQDKKASDWLYRLYDALRKQEASYELLCKYCEEDSETNDIDMPKEPDITNFCDFDRETQVALQEMYYMGESKWSRSICKCVEWVKNILGNANIKKGTGKKVEAKDVTRISYLPDDADADVRTVSQSDALKQSDTAIQPEMETALLSEESSALCLRPMEGEYPYIVPQKESMFIGRQEASCNYVLACRDISRIHASVVLKDEMILVTDLNSSNGTYVNEKRLMVQESVAVKRGDEVCFGSVRYVAV